jgi:hypothetical protein
MKSPITISNNTTSPLVRQVNRLRQELERLGIRQTVVQRYFRRMQLEQSQIDNDEERDEYDEIIANLEALESDIATYIHQLQDRLAHIEQGVSALMTQSHTTDAHTFRQYVLEDVRLCIRDAETARSGYNDLIANLSDITHLRDQ